MADTQTTPAAEAPKEKKEKHTLLKHLILAFGVKEKGDLLAIVKGGTTSEETTLRNKVEQIKEFVQMGLIEAAKGESAVKAFEDQILVLMSKADERKKSFVQTAGQAVESFLLTEEKEETK